MDMSNVRSIVEDEMLALVWSQDGSMRKRFDYADVLEEQIRALGLPRPTREFKPLQDRRFRLDLAWVDRMLFAECDGGEWSRFVARRHGNAKDCERWNTLTLAGWTGLRFVGSQITNGEALKVLE